MSQGNVFVYMQLCHRHYLFDKLCFLLGNYLVEDWCYTILRYCTKVLLQNLSRILCLIHMTEKLKFDYFMKNIPVTTKRSYF